MRLIFPVEPFDDHFAVGLYLVIELPPAQEHLVDHAALIEEHEIEHKAERRRGDDYGEEIYGSEHLRAYADRVHEQRKYQRYTYLKDDRAEDEQHRVLQRDAHIRVREQALVVFVPRLVHAVRRAAEAADVQEGVDNILNKRVVEKNDKKQERRNEKYQQRRFFLVYH